MLKKRSLEGVEEAGRNAHKVYRYDILFSIISLIIMWSVSRIKHMIVTLKVVWESRKFGRESKFGVSIIGTEGKCVENNIKGFECTLKVYNAMFTLINIHFCDDSQGYNMQFLYAIKKYSKNNNYGHGCKEQCYHVITNSGDSLLSLITSSPSRFSKF